MIEKEGRKLAKEYEKVLSINIEDIIEQETCTTIIDQKEPSEEPSENYTMTKKRVFPLYSKNNSGGGGVTPQPFFRLG